MPAKIIIAGEGGQGVQTIAKILTKAAQKSGKNVSYLPSFGVEQRGGVTLAYIQISSNPVAYPRFSKAEFVLALCNRSIEVVKNFITDRTFFIYDSAEIDEKNLKIVEDKVKNFIAVPAKKIAQEKFTTKVSNMILLGVLSAQLKDIDYKQIQDSIVTELAAKINKDPQIKDLNFSGFQAGLDFASNYESTQKLSGKLEIEIEKSFEKDGIKWTRFPEYCKGCSLCIVRCPVHALSFSKDLGFLGNPMPIVDMEKCTGCGTCQNICPDGAIRVEKS